MKTNFLMIENESALTELCEQLKGSPWLAIDTEFEREKTYYPELCLLQISNGDIAAVIDPLTIENIDPVLELLYDNTITKVFHSASQDLEIFYHLKGSVPTPLFDTQLAAPLLGYNEQIGYANLVKSMLGIELSKAHTRTDWKRRPLSREQLKYAVDDVIYLADIYANLHNELNKLGRLAWLDTDFSDLSDPERYLPNPDNMWLKVKQTSKLKGEKLSVVQSLISWRERKARQFNLPRKWMMRDDLCMDIARLCPENMETLATIKGLNQAFIKKHGDTLLKIIKDSKQQTPSKLPATKKRKSLSTEQEAIVDVLMSIIRIRAKENNLSPVILAPLKDLQHFVQGNENSILMKSWRKQMIGQELDNFLSGNGSVRIDSNKGLSIQKN